MLNFKCSTSRLGYTHHQGSFLALIGTGDVVVQLLVWSLKLFNFFFEMTELTTCRR